MLSSKYIVMLLSCASYIGGAVAVSLRRTVSGFDTFDKPGFTPIAQSVSNDRDGTLQYDPKISFVTSGGNTPDIVVVGIDPQSGTNLAVTKQNKTLFSQEDCTRLKSLYFGCTQPGATPAANLPLSCTLTVEALGPNDEVLDTQTQTFAFRPKLQGEINPLKVTAEMQEAVVVLKPARKFKISSRSTDTQALRGLLSLVGGLGIPVLELPGILQKLRDLFANVSDSAVDLLLDSIAYDTGVTCPT